MVGNVPPWLFLRRSLLLNAARTGWDGRVSRLGVSVDDGTGLGLSDGPGAAPPYWVLTVVVGLNVTVLCGRTGARDVVEALA